MSFYNQFFDLITSNEFRESNNRESQVHQFFERNPELIVTDNRYVSPGTVISKLPVHNWVSDFAYINPTSGFHYLFLIEIEDPLKNIFNRNDEFSQEFNHALQQVHDWLRSLRFGDEYLSRLYQDAHDQFNNNPDFRCDSPAPLVGKGKLIYGFRAEFQDNPIRRERWQQKKEAESQHVDIFTYDGLFEKNRYLFQREDRNFGSPGCVRYRQRRFTIITDPVT
ncbi:Shedu anti-phage system protein SduA domain-containing protein [Gluconobacter cerinus]|uniref:Shedu anti-phage system protein SduA domain-containing protein n=1 Tax=Gluconobacter cerinus TaxID=38307 RepID=UPI001B8D7376|nr:Shedu anti-phage system protein SduA domain-containing protein [Gluconobacter cerinus]MBS0984514.1 DUF4263 domain-containing protein [Gluconobacter cerinus]